MSCCSTNNIQTAIATKIRKISTGSSCFSGRRLAPLAAGEEVTPSLRSSYASVYYNITPYESDLSLNSACSNWVMKGRAVTFSVLPDFLRLLLLYALLYVKCQLFQISLYSYATSIILRLQKCDWLSCHH